MSTPSILTQNLSPFLSIQTTLSNTSTVGYVKFPSWVTVEIAGTTKMSGTPAFTGATSFTGALTSTATLNAQAAKFLSKSTTASLTSVTLVDGEMAIGAISATSATIYFRSGVTTYRFIAPVAGAVL